jgi:hypothetical protein
MGSTRDLIRDLIAGGPVRRCGFWLGHPHPETWPGLHHHFGTNGEEELRRRVGDDCRWICPQFYADVYQDPEGRVLFDAGLDRLKHSRNAKEKRCVHSIATAENSWQAWG